MGIVTCCQEQLPWTRSMNKKGIFVAKDIRDLHISCRKLFIWTSDKWGRERLNVPVINSNGWILTTKMKLNTKRMYLTQDIPPSTILDTEDPSVAILTGFVGCLIFLPPGLTDWWWWEDDHHTLMSIYFESGVDEWSSVTVMMVRWWWWADEKGWKDSSRRRRRRKRCLCCEVKERGKADDVRPSEGRKGSNWKDERGEKRAEGRKEGSEQLESRCDGSSSPSPEC